MENKDSNKTGLGWGTSILFPSNYIILPHPCPKPKPGYVDESPSLFIEKNDKLIPAYLNLVMYFCLDGKNDFPKTKDITSIHKILNEKIHNFHTYTLFKKSKKHHKNFERPQ